MRVPNMVQTEQDLRDLQDLLYAKSKEGKSFTGILELIANEQTIITAMHNIKSNKGAKTAGIDGKTVESYLQMPYEELICIVKKHLNDYRPYPVRRVYIAKRNSRKKRPLGIPAFIDRIIQECVRIVLEPILEARFYGHSYGFRPYRATQYAIGEIVERINSSKVYWGIEGDVRAFFDNVNHKLLIQKLWRLGIIDKRVLAIIKKMLKAGVLEKGVYMDTLVGTPQGGILSPLLANAYLNDFDWTVARMYVKPSNEHRFKHRGDAQRTLKSNGIIPKFIVRFADDWIVLTQSEKEANKLFRWLKKYYRYRLKLELSEEKTLITHAKEKPFQFLGFCIKAELRRRIPSKPIPKITGKPYPNPLRVKEQIRDLIQEVRNLFLCKNDGLRAVDIENLNARIVGMAEYWKHGISKRVLAKIDYHIHEAAYRVFCKIYKKKYVEYRKPLCELANRTNRHLFDAKGKALKRETRTWAVLIDGLWIGITHASITPTQYCQKYNQKQTPFTKEGRELYLKNKLAKKLPLARTPLYDEDTLLRVLGENKRIYNFEYIMNREYALNQTLRHSKGIYACQICGCELVYGNRTCHHKNPHLPIEKINKVSNLIWLCRNDHYYVEHGIPNDLELEKKRSSKIEKLRKIKFGFGNELQEV